MRQIALPRPLIGEIGLTLLLIGLASALASALLSQPWRLQASIGGADSMALAGGFYAKELTPTGRPFRWTNGAGVVRVPSVSPTSLIALTIDPGTLSPTLLTIREQSCAIAAFPVEPGFRTYHVLWPASCPTRAIASPAAQEITLESAARSLSDGDLRRLGVAVSAIEVRAASNGGPAATPVALVGLSIGALAGLVRPRTRWRALGLAAAAAGMPLLYGLLVWQPAPALIATWLPLSWLPGAIAGGLWGLLLARWAEGRPLAALAALLGVGALIAWQVGVLFSAWAVSGPDYGWHLNHGGSWQRVFRAHGYYPFGFPLILWLGELAGGRDIWYGRVASLLATIALVVASGALAWRVAGQRYAWLALLALAGSPTVVAYGVLASTDAPFAALAALALLALCWSPQLGVRQAALAGLALGGAYLFRFQALMLLIPILIWAAPLRFVAPAEGWPRRASWLLRPAIVIGLAFIVGSAPQWIVELADSGRPINSQQYTNIWNFAYQRSDAVPTDQPGGPLWYVISYDPAAIVINWLGNLREFAEESVHLLLIWPLGLLALIGAASALDRLATDRRLALLLISSAVYIALVAVAANKARFFLPIIPALATLCALLLSHWHAILLAGGRRFAWLYPVGVALLWVVVLQHLLAAEAELLIYRL